MRRGREDVALSPSLIFLSVFEPGTQTRISPSAVVASLQHLTIAVVSTVFGRREQIGQRYTYGENSLGLLCLFSRRIKVGIEE